MKIAILGAECTGKTQLAQALTLALKEHPGGASWIAETLREWCAVNGRTPKSDEQLAIALEHEKRMDSAAPVGFLLADTTALMTAIYSDLLFNDRSLYPIALDKHRRYDLTLVTGLDLPWVPDGVQRDGPQSQSSVDTRLREVLQTHRIDYAVVYGQGSDRADCALQTILQHTKEAPNSALKPSAWRWNCEKCSDAACEHRQFSALLERDSVRV